MFRIEPNLRDHGAGKTQLAYPSFHAPTWQQCCSSRAEEVTNQANYKMHCYHTREAGTREGNLSYSL